MKALRKSALAALLASLCMASGAQAATATRTSAFEYDPATGLLSKEIIEPDNPQLRLETAYIYDAYGNKIAATVSSPATGHRHRSHCTAYQQHRLRQPWSVSGIEHQCTGTKRDQSHRSEIRCHHQPDRSQ